MGSESTSKFEVRNPKSRKRTKKKDKLKDTSENENTEIEMCNEEIAANKKRSGKKRKSGNNRKLNGNDQEIIKTNEQKVNFSDAQQNPDNEESSDETKPPKKFGKTNATHIESDQEETEEPTKSDNKNSKEPSKRQIKREKAEKRENDKREASRLEATQKALNYVSKWKHARSEWKFEKLRQIWLIENLLDENSIPDDIFPTVLEYFEGCKGMAREQLLKKGMDAIRQVEEDEENRDERMESVVYDRARKLLQALPTET